MTMALLYRNGEEAFFLQDFRITHKDGKQIDAMMKYFSFGGRLGMFFAGDVAAVKRLIPHIRSVEPQITINNVLEQDGPLAKAIESYMMSNPDGLLKFPKVKILGFLIDHQTKSNRCFQVEAEVGSGSRLTDTKENEVIIIGSGNSINNISSKLTNIANNAINNGFDINSALEATRRHLKIIFERVGVSAYNKLGISPIFAGSILSGGYFEMKGEQITGGRYTSDFGPKGATPAVEFDYSFSRSNGDIILISNLSDEMIVVKEVELYVEGPFCELFDPEGLDSLFDPSQHANTNGVIYIINQWVINNRLVDRTVDKTYLKNEICDLDYIRLAEELINTKCPQEISKYCLSGKHYFIVPENLQSTFEDDLSKHLFDHNWLLQYVDNYSDLYQ